jgi:glucosamine-6-phosphate deaminase
MGEDSAAAFAATLREMLAKKDAVNVIFAAAPSQSDFLAALEREADIDWKRVNVFHMDEYIGIDNDHPQSFAKFVKTHVADQFAVGAFYPLNGACKSVSEECARYEKLLREFPVDIVCMGIGENGHIAFNDPGVADFTDPVLVKTAKLDEVCRNQQVHDGCFETLADVPTHALTLTCPTLMNATYQFCVVPAPTKAQAAKRMLNGEISEECPCTALRRADHAALYLDPDSASLL